MNATLPDPADANGGNAFGRLTEDDCKRTRSGNLVNRCSPTVRWSPHLDLGDFHDTRSMWLTSLKKKLCTLQIYGFHRRTDLDAYSPVRSLGAGAVLSIPATTSSHSDTRELRN